MRAAFSHIGSKIWCEGNFLTGSLICAALIGRRVFILAVAVLAAVTIVKRLRYRHEALVDESVVCVPATIAASSDAEFKPPRDYRAAAIADVSALHNALRRAIVGQGNAIEALMVALIAGGHVLLEGPPGLAKTLACRTLAGSIDATFSRIQCTADLLPAEIVGSEIFDQRDLSFKTRLGPLFANVVLVDEINRAPAQTQAALLEALEERQVSLGGAAHRLPEPFLVLGTMNEIEADGIYSLPAAQVDRFLLKVLLHFPSRCEELEILDRFGGGLAPCVKPAVSIETVSGWRGTARTIYCAPRLMEYMVALVRATRHRALEGGLEYGAGPRAALAILAGARAKAMIAGRVYVLPKDVQSIACAALRHRVAFADTFLLDREERERRLSDVVDGVPLP